MRLGSQWDQSVGERPWGSVHEITEAFLYQVKLSKSIFILFVLDSNCFFKSILYKVKWWLNLTPNKTAVDIPAISGEDCSLVRMVEIQLQQRQGLLALAGKQVCHNFYTSVEAAPFHPERSRPGVSRVSVMVWHIDIRSRAQNILNWGLAVPTMGTL